METESWENYINIKNLILIEDASEDLEIKPYELIHQMRRNHPKPIKLWLDLLYFFPSYLAGNKWYEF